MKCVKLNVKVLNEKKGSGKVEILHKAVERSNSVLTKWERVESKRSHLKEKGSQKL